MARPERFELPTTWFEARYSIQLSYGRMDPFAEARMVSFFGIEWEIAIASANHQQFIGQSAMQPAAAGVAFNQHN